MGRPAATHTPHPPLIPSSFHPSSPPPHRPRGAFNATTDFSALTTCDAVSICVPTPLNKTGDPDISYIVSATEQIACYLHPGMVIVLESTTYPGTTTDVMLPILVRGEGRGRGAKAIANGRWSNCHGQ